MNIISKTLLTLLAGLYCASLHADLVLGQPVGTAMTYDLSTVQHYSGESYDFSGIYSRVVFDGSDVWFENPLTFFGIGSWLKGTLEGDVIRIPNGQLIYHQDAVDVYPELDIFVNSGRWNGNTAVSDGKEYAEMRLMPDGSIYMPDNRVLMGVDQYGGLITFNQGYLYVPVDINDVVIPPADAERRQYSLHYLQDFFNEDIYILTELAVDGDDFYIKGLCGKYAPESWSKGKREGDYVNFPSRQLQGIADDDFLDYMSGGVANYSGALDGYDMENRLQFLYDEKNGHLISGQAVLETIGDRIFVDAYNSPELRPYEPSAAYPAAPVMRDFMAYPEYGFRVVRFKISPVDNEGNYIDPKGITWRLIADDGPFTFETSCYTMLDSPREVFSWGETDTGDAERGQDIVFESCGLYNVWLYDMEINTLAVECTYTHDGVSHSVMSNTLVFDPSGVETVGADNSQETLWHIDGSRVVSGDRGVILGVDRKSIIKN